MEIKAESSYHGATIIRFIIRFFWQSRPPRKASGDD
jgi:hypothetical protein